MATIEQARADRARDNLARTIEQRELAQQDLHGANSRSDVARAAGSRSRPTLEGDGVDGKNPQTTMLATQTATTDGAIVHTATGENPFGMLVDGSPQAVSVVEELVLGDALPLGSKLAPDIEKMMKMTSLQASGFKQRAAGMQGAAGKVRVGTMLLLADDASVAEEKLGDAKSNADALAGTLIENANGDEHVARTIISQHVMTSQFPAGMDVNAYVEQVLREAYMIQQGVLEDYAAEMDQINTARKAMRDRLARLNALKSRASTGSASVNDLKDLGVTLDPGEVDNLGGNDFNWPKQTELEAAEDELAALQGQPLTHQADIQAAKDESEPAPDLWSRLHTMLSTDTGASNPTLHRAQAGALSQVAPAVAKLPTPAATTPSSSVPGGERPADANSSAKAEQIREAKDRVQELMSEKVDAVAADPSHADEVKTFLAGKVDAAIDTQKGDLDGANGDAEMMQLQLQDAMQKSQELMQMMSNMSKVVHDTLMSVIRNIGG